MSVPNYGKISLREAFGKALVDAGKIWDDIRVLDAGTKNSTMSQLFERAYPDKFYSPGINEPGMISLATGIAMSGKRVVACDMSVFLHHAYAQLQTAARQGPDLHLIVAASHTGIAVGPDGGSAHDLTDLARMRLLPNFTVLTPWDGNQTHQALFTALEKPGYYYIRLNRPALPIFTEPDEKFVIGRSRLFNENPAAKLTIIATGDRVYPALIAAEKLGQGIAEVIGISTLEPLDQELIIRSAKRTGRVITVEDHMYVGGLFESIAGVLALNHPTPIKWIALNRQFTTSGEPDQLASIYKIDIDSIVQCATDFLSV